ncbi:hypothetical protein BDV18DRAFT_162572 [Aspergillus unguis]
MHLPAEILVAIADQIFDPADGRSWDLHQKDKLNLLQVSRYWNSVLLGVVYGSLRIDEIHFRPLTELVLVNPRIQNSIRGLSTSWGDSEHEGDAVTLTERVLERVGQLSESVEEKNEWVEALRRLDQDAWLALLLGSLPKLTTLSSNWRESAPWMTMMVSRAAYNNSALQQLTTLEVENADSKDNFATYLVLPFFHLPSLRSVSLTSVNDSEYIPRPADHPAMHAAPGTSPVESLTFNEPCNGRYGMNEIIRSCKNLREFVYEHEDQVKWGELYRVFRPRPFYGPLSAHSHCLEVLHLNNYAYSNDSDDDEEEDEGGPHPRDRWFGSLAGFSRLWDVHMRVANLLPLHPLDSHSGCSLKDSLPPNLRWLCLSDCEEWHPTTVYGELLDLLSHRQTLFPKLEKVEIISCASEDDTRKADPLFGQIRDACENQGVQFGVFRGDKSRVWPLSSFEKS